MRYSSRPCTRPNCPSGGDISPEEGVGRGAQHMRVSQAKTAFPPRELESLTRNIANIGNLASQVVLKGRVEGAEASRPTSEDHRPTTHAAESRILFGYIASFTGMRKRAGSPGFDPAPRKPNFSTDYADFSGQGYATPPAWPVNNPPTSTSREDAPESDVKSAAATPAKRRRYSGRVRKTTPTDAISMCPRKQ
ncbi:hypothetical protein VTK26DRAFT_2353 [Humicola hyalothermophila]